MSAPPITESDIRRMLWDRIKAPDMAPLKVKDLAAQVGVSTAFMSYVLSGKRKPSTKVLDFLGLKSARTITVTYQRKRS